MLGEEWDCMWIFFSRPLSGDDEYSHFQLSVIFEILQGGAKYWLHNNPGFTGVDVSFVGYTRQCNLLVPGISFLSYYSLGLRIRYV